MINRFKLAGLEIKMSSCREIAKRDFAKFRIYEYLLSILAFNPQPREFREQIDLDLLDFNQAFPLV